MIGADGTGRREHANRGAGHRSYGARRRFAAHRRRHPRPPRASASAVRRACDRGTPRLSPGDRPEISKASGEQQDLETRHEPMAAQLKYPRPASRGSPGLASRNRTAGGPCPEWLRGERDGHHRMSFYDSGRDQSRRRWHVNPTRSPCRARRTPSDLHKALDRADADRAKRDRTDPVRRSATRCLTSGVGSPVPHVALPTPISPRPAIPGRGRASS